MSLASTEQIAKTPGICGGRACMVGHRIRVADIVAWHERRGDSPDEIVTMFPGLDLADVHAALASSFDHRVETNEDLADDELISNESRISHNSILSLVVFHSVATGEATANLVELV